MTGAGFGYASILMLENAQRPAPISTTRAVMTIARRDSAKVRSALSMRRRSPSLRPRRSRRGPGSGQHIAEKQGRLRGHQLAGLQSLEDLVEPVLLKADFYAPLDQTPSVS